MTKYIALSFSPSFFFVLACNKKKFKFACYFMCFKCVWVYVYKLHVFAFNNKIKHINSLKIIM